MRKYISPHYLLSGLLGMLALVLSVSCDDTDVVRRVDPQIEVQADLFTGPAASRQVLPLHSTYPWFAEASASWIKLQRYRGLKPSQNADLQIDGEITGYNQYNQAVSADGYSSETKLTITVNVRFVNNTNHAEDFEQQFSAFRTYDSTQLLTAVQDGLIAEMSKEITDQIFNATVANW